MFPDSRYGLIAGAVYSALLVWAAVGDVIWRRIPNWLVAAVIVCGFVYALAFMPWNVALGSSVPGFLTGLGLWLPFYVLGWVGAGDVKLFAAAGVWMGPLRTIEGAGIAALAGGLLAVVWMIWSYGVRRAADSLWVAAVLPAALAESGARSAQSRRTLPYGVALAAGALVAAWMPRLLVFG